MPSEQQRLAVTFWCDVNVWRVSCSHCRPPARFWETHSFPCPSPCCCWTALWGIAKGLGHNSGHRGGENTLATTPGEVAGAASPTKTPLYLLILLICCTEHHAKTRAHLRMAKLIIPKLRQERGGGLKVAVCWQGGISGSLVASLVSASPPTSQEICSSLVFLRLLPLAQTAWRWPAWALTQHRGAASPVATLLCSLPVLVGTRCRWVMPGLLQDSCWKRNQSLVLTREKSVKDEVFCEVPVVGGEDGMFYVHIYLKVLRQWGGGS